MYNGTFTYYPFWILATLIIGIIFFPILAVVFFGVLLGISVDDYYMIAIFAEIVYIGILLLAHWIITLYTPDAYEELKKSEDEYVKTFISSNEKYKTYTIGDIFLLEYKERDEMTNVVYANEVIRKKIVYKYAVDKNKSIYDLVKDKDEDFFELLKNNGICVNSNEFNSLKRINNEKRKIYRVK